MHNRHNAFANFCFHQIKIENSLWVRFWLFKYISANPNRRVKGGAEKTRLKRNADLKDVENNPKQLKLCFASNNVLLQSVSIKNYTYIFNKKFFIKKFNFMHCYMQWYIHNYLDMWSVDYIVSRIYCQKIKIGVISYSKYTYMHTSIYFCVWVFKYNK